MNIENFKGSVRDLARPNRFEVTLARAGDLQFTAKGTDVPPNTVDAMDVNYQGRIIKFTGDRTNPDWTLTVYGKESYETYNAFEQWMVQINDPVANVSAAPSAVKEDGIIKQLGRDGSTLKQWKLVGAFPIELGSLPFDWSSNSTPLEFSVTLAYDYALPV